MKIVLGLRFGQVKYLRFLSGPDVADNVANVTGHSNILSCKAVDDGMSPVQLRASDLRLRLDKPGAAE
jgi:hypothetical protein